MPPKKENKGEEGKKERGGREELREGVRTGKRRKVEIQRQGGRREDGHSQFLSRRCAKRFVVQFELKVTLAMKALLQKFSDNHISKFYKTGDAILELGPCLSSRHTDLVLS